jgi:hypothetical protein
MVVVILGLVLAAGLYFLVLACIAWLLEAPRRRFLRDGKRGKK